MTQSYYCVENICIEEVTPSSPPLDILEKRQALLSGFISPQGHPGSWGMENGVSRSKIRCLMLGLVRMSFKPK